MKKNTKIGIFSMIFAVAALLAGTGMNIALADHGGDNGNRGRSNRTVQTSQTTQNVQSNQSNNSGDNENENENVPANNNDARILALETEVQQLNARILVLEQKAGVSDITAPVISGTASTNIAQTTADISWATNEAATSKVYFSTTTPVNLATSATVVNPTLVVNHSLHLTGLTANTTYHFIVESKDAANNTTVSPEQSFATAL